MAKENKCLICIAGGDQLQSLFDVVLPAIIAGFIVELFNHLREAKSIDTDLVYIIMVLLAIYLLRKPLLSFVKAMFRRLIDYRSPSFKEILERSRQGFLDDKVFNISLLWASTWFIGVMTPIFLLIPYRERVTIPAEVLPIIVLAAITPAAMVMAVGVLRMMWQDWKRSKTRKQKVFWGIRILGAIAFAVTIVLLGR